MPFSPFAVTFKKFSSRWVGAAMVGSCRGWREGQMRLLLIEDDVHVAQVLAEAFGVDGHETAVRYTGEDGLAYLTRERPDAVVLDVRLPALNGVAVLRKIRSTDPALPVIIMTGLATPGE